MERAELDNLARKVETVVDRLKVTKASNEELLSEKKRLEQRITSLDRQLHQSQKEGDQIKELVTQNKAYRKKCALLKSRVVSLLAKIEGLQ